MNTETLMSLTLVKLLAELRPGRVLYADFTQANGLDLFGKEPRIPTWRRVVSATSYQICFDKLSSNGVTIEHTYLRFPKASELESVSGGFRINWTDGGRVTYTFEGE
jgi:hypothetical protein